MYWPRSLQFLNCRGSHSSKVLCGLHNITYIKCLQEGTVLQKTDRSRIFLSVGRSQQAHWNAPWVPFVPAVFISYFEKEKTTIFLLWIWIVIFVFGIHQEGKCQTSQSEKEDGVFDKISLMENKQGYNSIRSKTAK